MNQNEKLLVDTQGGVKRITFNNPARRNALDLDTFALFADAVEEAARDESRVVVITGAGDSFCGGLDLTSLSTEELATLDVAAKIRELINPPILKLRALRKPVVARVNGPVAGIGFSYVLASDVRVASADATFMQSFARVGLMPDGGSTHFLPAQVGYAKAFEIMATAPQLSAQDAHALGPRREEQLVGLAFLDDDAGFGKALGGLAGDRGNLGIDRGNAEIGRIGDAFGPGAAAHRRAKRFR